MWRYGAWVCESMGEWECGGMELGCVWRYDDYGDLVLRGGHIKLADNGYCMGNVGLGRSE